MPLTGRHRIGNFRHKIIFCTHLFSLPAPSGVFLWRRTFVSSKFDVAARRICIRLTVFVSRRKRRRPINSHCYHAADGRFTRIIDVARSIWPHVAFCFRCACAFQSRWHHQSLQVQNSNIYRKAADSLQLWRINKWPRDRVAQSPRTPYVQNVQNVQNMQKKNDSKALGVHTRIRPKQNAIRAT